MRIFFFILGIMGCLFTTAQQSLVRYGFKYDTVHIRPGATFSNSIWIENNSSEAVTLFQSNASAGSRGLLNLPDSIHLQAGEKRTFPLKYFANQHTIRRNFQAFPITLIAPGKNIAVQKEAQFLIRTEEHQGIFIDTDEPEIYLSQFSRQTRFVVHCYNKGLIPASFHLELSNIPEGLEFTGERNIPELLPGTQQALVFTAVNKLRRSVASDFSVIIRALDPDGRQLAAKSLRMLSISSDKRLGLNQATFAQNPSNTAALRYLTVSPNLSARQLQVNGTASLSDSQQLRYQLNADHLSTPDQKGINLYDTYIDYQSGRWGARAGTIYDLLDFNINGRGVKAGLKTGTGRSLNFYGVENTYLLYSSLQALPQNKGHTFAIQYRDIARSEKSRSFVLLQNNNAFSRIRTALASGTMTMPVHKNGAVSVEAGYSILYSKNEMAHKGFAAGLKYATNQNRFNIYSYNYYASPYYGGLRRGLFQLDNSISLSLDAHQTLFVNLRVMRNNPRLLYYFGNEYLSAASHYGNAIYEAGYGRRMGQWNVVLRPYYFTQTIALLNEKDRWRSASLRGKLVVNYSYGAHTLFFEADNGYTFQNTSGKPEAPFVSSRINASYNSQVLGFSALAQFNSYYLTDALALTLDRPKYTFLSLGPTASFALFRQKVFVNSAFLYNYSGYNRSSNYAATGNIRWHIRNNWSLATDMLYGINVQPTAYNVAVGSGVSYDPGDPSGVYRYSNRQFRLSIEKKFGHDNGSTNRKLELFYFEDLNVNGIFDKGEPVGAGVLVKIDGTTAITNHKGIVSFTGEKNKQYAITIVNNRNWNLLHPVEITLRKNTRLAIPLVKTELLSGKLIYIADKYAGTAPPPAGLRVKAVSENGHVFTTLTNEQGQFSLYLPENKYEVSIEAEGLHFKLLHERQTIQVQHDHKKTIEFEYAYRERKIEVTRFE